MLKVRLAVTANVEIDEAALQRAGDVESAVDLLAEAALDMARRDISRVYVRNLDELELALVPLALPVRCPA